jgi:hypothetical protein
MGTTEPAILVSGVVVETGISWRFIGTQVAGRAVGQVANQTTRLSAMRER